MAISLHGHITRLSTHPLMDFGVFPPTQALLNPAALPEPATRSAGSVSPTDMSEPSAVLEGAAGPL